VESVPDRLGALAISQGYIGPEILGYLSLMAIVTMSLSTYVINYNSQIWARVEPWFARFESPDKRDVDLKTYRNHAVVIGYDEITKQTLPLLEAQYDDVVVVDRNPQNTAFLRQSQYDYVYGDFKHSELRKAVGLGRAAFVLSSSVERDINRTVLRETRDDAVVFAEANSIEDAIDLYREGATYVIISTLLTSQELTETLESYLETPDEFQQRVTRDVAALKGSGTNG
jgi:DNA-binding NarL/FixJ family response regulator